MHAMAALSSNQLIVLATKALPSSSTNNLRRPSLHPYSVKITMMAATVSTKPSYSRRWASINADIAANLHLILAKREPEPLQVRQPMHELIFAAPETMAPALCIATCELVGGQRTEAAVATASAVYLVHAAARTREHLPSLLGRKTLDANAELLMGECISSLGFEVLSLSCSRGSSERVLRAVVELARAGGAQGMVGGLHEHLKWAAAGGAEDGNRMERMKEVCRKKEGELHACGAACGAILGGAGEEEIEKLRRFGHHVGTMHGLLHGTGKGEKDGLAAAMELAPLALRELEGFEEKTVSEISSLVDMVLGQ